MNFISTVQFTLATTLFMLACFLLLGHIPNTPAYERYKKSCRYLAYALLWLSLHFIMQWHYQWRLYDEDFAILVNLIFYHPAFALTDAALIYIQGKGMVRPKDVIINITAYFAELVILFFVYQYCGPSMLRYAEEACATLAGILLLYNSNIILQGYKKIHLYLDSYYEKDMVYMVKWMRNTSVFMIIIGILVPIMIFMNNQLATLLLLIIIIGMANLTCNFIFYGFNLYRIQRAEKASYEPQRNAETEELRALVNQWIEQKGYVDDKITIISLAKKLGTNRNKLSIYVNAEIGNSFREWINELRINEAKTMLIERPEANIETIAHDCGFSSRNYFQVIFRERTGVTPTQYRTDNTGQSATNHEATEENTEK